MWELLFCPVHGLPAILMSLFGCGGSTFLLTVKSYFGSLIQQIKKVTK